jgi:hypothetical protein
MKDIIDVEGDVELGIRIWIIYLSNSAKSMVLLAVGW